MSDLLVAGGFLLLAIVWGGTFPVIKNLVAAMPPHSLVAVRFAVATGVLGLWVVRRRGLWRPGLLRAGGLLGVVLGGGYVTQTVGLQFTSASKAGFITALSVVFIPLLARVISGRHTTRVTWFGVAAAAVGLALLSIDWEAGLRLETGDVLVLACAVLFAAHIVLVDRYARRYDAVLLTWVQLGAVALMSTVTAFVFEGGVVGVQQPAHWWPLLYLAVPATAVAIGLQVYLQQFAVPVRAGLILSLEPVFAALFAWLLLGETMVVTGWLGGAFVLIGVVLAELDDGVAPTERQQARHRDGTPSYNEH